MDTFDYKKYLKENKLVNEESFDLKVKDFPMEFTLERDINYDSWGVHEDKLYKGTFVKDLILSDHKRAIYVNHEGKQEVTLDQDDIRNLERLGVLKESLKEIKNYSKILKSIGNKKETYPVTIVATRNGKIVRQETVNKPIQVPAIFNIIQFEERGEGGDVKVYIKSRTGEILLIDKNLDEAKKKKKKDPPIGKPKRGGSKAYYVYVRDPKTKRIKKVSFGSGGLRAKIRNPKARKAFAARHRCSEKNDRTKASYWSCRLPRYAKQLGLGSNMNTFW